MAKQVFWRNRFYFWKTWFPMSLMKSWLCFLITFLQRHQLLLLYQHNFALMYLSICHETTKWCFQVNLKISKKQFIKTTYTNFCTGKSLPEAFLFGDHWENMLCTEIVLDVKNNFCTQHVLPRFELRIFMHLNL